jgi:hypothetical protein
MSQRRWERLTAIIAVVSLAISGITFVFSFYAWNLASNYPASVEIRNAPRLELTEKCESNVVISMPEGNLTIKTCNLTGAFNLSFSIISPHVGTYRINITSFFPSSSKTSDPWTLAELMTFVKGRNATLAREEMWILLTQFEMSTPIAGNVPINGFEKTEAIAVRATIGRSLGYSQTITTRLGTLFGLLTYYDLQLEKNIQREFSVDVWIEQG